jgi:hypothetical protein
MIKMKASPCRHRPRSPLRTRDLDYCPSNMAHTLLLYARGQASSLVTSKFVLTLVGAHGLRLDKTSADDSIMIYERFRMLPLFGLVL